MSQKRTIKLDLDAKDVIQKLEHIEKELADVKKGVKDGAEEMTRLGESTNLTATGMTGLAGQIGIVAVSLKALAIRAIYGAFDTFFNILKTNQRVLDATNKAFETMSIFTRSLINDMIGFTRKSVLKDFFQEFEKAVPTLKKVVDSITNMSDKLRVLKAGISGFANLLGLQDRIADATELADKIVDLRNQVILAEADQRLLQSTYEREAEIQRQIRDDIRKTPEERKKANDRLGEILQEQLTAELKVAEIRLELAKLEKSTDEENIQFQANYTNALAELADIRNRITGQESEQKTNAAALDQEIHDQRMNDGVETITLIHKTTKEEETATDNAIRLMNKRLKAHKKTSEGEVEITKLTEATKRDIVANSLGQVAGLMGEETKAGKALAIAQAIINTYSAASAALAPPPTGAGPIFGPIAAIGAIAAGMANVAKIRSTNLPGVSGDSGGGQSISGVSSGGGSGSVEQQLQGLIPNFENITGGDGGSAPVQAYVVETDISNAQALQEELDLRATL